jgi:hypothetical protein
MIASDLITILREDFLYDVAQPYRWSDAFLLRSLIEAERQAASRWNLIFDNSQPIFGLRSELGGLDVTQNGTQLGATPQICAIPLINQVATYQLSTLITYIKSVFINDIQIGKLSEDELNRSDRMWRRKSGIGLRAMKSQQVSDIYSPSRGFCRPKAIVRGRSITITPYPDANIDATFSQLTAPSTTNVGDTWFNQTDSNLYQWSGTSWVLTPDAPLGYINLEIYRLPLATQIDVNYTPEIAEEHHRQLLYWVLYDAYLKKDSDETDPKSYDPQRAAGFLELFNTYFGRQISAAERAMMLEENPSTEVRAHNYDTFYSEGW